MNSSERNSSPFKDLFLRNDKSLPLFFLKKALTTKYASSILIKVTQMNLRKPGLDIGTTENPQNILKKDLKNKHESLVG